jgi:type II secretory pathway pseudopilin PulG
MSSKVVAVEVSGVMKKENGLTVLDTLLVCILIGVFIAIMMTYYGRTIQAARETALKANLASIRLSIQLYQVVNGRYPLDLKELITKRFLMPTQEGTIFSDRYLQAQALDSSGFPIDPFDQRYRYDPMVGRVSSASRGYEHW